MPALQAAPGSLRAQPALDAVRRVRASTLSIWPPWHAPALTGPEEALAEPCEMEQPSSPLPSAESGKAGTSSLALPWQRLHTAPKLSPRELPDDAPEKQHSLSIALLDAEPVALPWQQPAMPPRLSPRDVLSDLELGGATKREDDADAVCTTKPPARSCDVCGGLFATPVCRCSTMSLTHPIEKILAQACSRCLQPSKAPRHKLIKWLDYDDELVV